MMSTIFYWLSFRSCDMFGSAHIDERLDENSNFTITHLQPFLPQIPRKRLRPYLYPLESQV